MFRSFVRKRSTFVFQVAWLRPAQVCALLMALGLLFVSAPSRAAWPSLEEAIKRARSRAPSVIQAEGSVLTARSVGVGARMSMFHNPYLEVLLDKDASGRAGGGLAIQGLLSLPIEVSGQRPARIREADSLLDWQQIVKLDTQARVLGAVVVAYGDSLVASGRISLAEMAEKEAQAEYAYFAGRAEVGGATVVDRGLAESEAARYGQLRAEAELVLIRSIEQLRILTELPSLEPPKEESVDPPPLRSESFEAYVQATIARSPTLKALDLEARYYDQQAERAETERGTPMSVLITGGRGELGEARIGGGLAWSFPMIRRNQGEIARARAEEARARMVRPSVAHTLRAQAQAAFEEYLASRRAVEALDRVGIPAGTRVVDATLEAYRAGKLELVRVLNARRDLAVTRGRRLDLLSTAWRAYGDLAALRGEQP